MRENGTLYYIPTEKNNTKYLHEKYQQIYRNNKVIYHISAKKVMKWTNDIIAMKSKKIQMIQIENRVLGEIYEYLAHRSFQIIK
jgi:hypothetical protein